MTSSANDDVVYLRQALTEASDAEANGEVPVGAIIVHGDKIIGRGQNRVLRDSDPTAHAEIVALRHAGLHLRNYRLADCTLYVTLEPCAMCAGAILHARISRLVYAAPDPKAGACGSVLSVMNHPRLNHKVEVTPNLLAEECGTLLTTFFRKRRQEKSQARILQNEAATGQSDAAAERTPWETIMATKKKWSADVDTDSTHPDEGLFKKNASAIAKALATKKVSPKGPASGMQMLNFYINRAGKNLSKERHAELEKTKTLLSEIIAKEKPTSEEPSKKAAKKKAPKKATKKVTNKTTKEASAKKSSPAKSSAKKSTKK
ncbi:tRNA adenosine(34) deaminase TadA [Tunturiibacter empetritectus]|uniref:tRNA-specific adenosine deaminase n=1 Tax=Tunturiibacter lichenicola TaxID=2051959 RepID=A0A852V7V5_9BACT|nr:tRNA adenosine(34) deaminase TadA [Edaphobacter lichenicola]NYF89068.1 tRNA(adenine34) deaminase [Edaphobacter lichenicola]